MAKKNGKATETDRVLDIPVEFGGVSIGDATARLGLHVDRGALNLLAADEVFCGHRLVGQIILGRHDDQPDQQMLMDDYDLCLDGTFDVKRISVNQKAISTGLTFSLADIDVAELAKFSRGSGRLVVNTVNELPDDVPLNEDDDIPPGTLQSDGPWRNVQLSTLFEGALLKSLVSAGLTNVGLLSDYTATEKRLTDIDGIGPGKAEAIENTMLAFWRDNPQYCDGKTA